jgi:hypothetical protein
MFNDDVQQGVWQRTTIQTNVFQTNVVKGQMCKGSYLVFSTLYNKNSTRNFFTYMIIIKV